MDQILILKIFIPVILSVLILVWFIWKKTNWKKRNKWMATVGVAVVFLFVFIFSIENNKPISKETTLPATPAEEPKNITVEIAPNVAEETVKVDRVIDGDTIKLESGQLVRYIGINAPETVDPETPVQCFGKEASVENKKLVEGRTVRLEKDISETDKYGRLLRYVYLGDIFVNDYLVRNGFARADNFPPDEKFKDQFKAAQAEAKNDGRGLWGKCK